MVDSGFGRRVGGGGGQGVEEFAARGNRKNAVSSPIG